MRHSKVHCKHRKHVWGPYVSHNRTRKTIEECSVCGRLSIILKNGHHLVMPEKDAPPGEWDAFYKHMIETVGKE